MARSFKISFPLPRQPSASPNLATPGSEYSNKSRHDDSPLSYPGSKAERTLGASEPARPERKTKHPEKLKRPLRKTPSFMSVTLSEIDGDYAQAPDGFPFPGMLFSGPASRQPTQYLSRQGSSPLLGELYTKESTHADSMSIATAPQARRTDSLSTLRSHYDSTKLPLPVSQQTSASSARDMALRKGHPSISSPLGFRKVDEVKTPEPNLSHSRNVSGGSKVSAASNLSGNSIKRINGMPRRRPSVTDPPTLYPNANRAASHAVSPPSALINSSLPKTLPPNIPPKRLKWWQRKASSPKVSSPVALEDPPYREGPFEENFSSIKVNVKKPKLGATGARNWFDDLEDEDQTLQDRQHPGIERPIYERPEPPLSLHEIMSQEAHLATTSAKSSLSNQSQQPASSGRKLSFRLDSSPQHVPTMLSSLTNIPRSTPSSPQGKSIRSATISKSAHSGMDLQVESFLELSSSEDEGGESSAPSEACEPYRRHRIRASIERASYNNEVSVGSAQRAQPVRPRSIAKRTSSRPPSKRPTSSEIVPPVPRIPDRPIKLVQRTSSMRWREMMEEKTASTESTIDSGASSLTDNANGRKQHSSGTKKKPSMRGSKLMKVTSEEEKLLEAMRDKRASIRQDDFEKGFKTAMQLQEIVARPKTAGADGRTSRSSAYGSRSSSSSIVAGSHLSASADDFLLEDSYPFPKVPPSRGISLNLKSPLGFVSPPKASPSLSFSPSDILPSTPTSRNSPMTPPTGHGSVGVYGRCSTLSPSRGVIVTNKLGHDRKRTTSSSVVMLDGVEQHARELDEADEISGWAMNRW